MPSCWADPCGLQARAAPRSASPRWSSSAGPQGTRRCPGPPGAVRRPGRSAQYSVLRGAFAWGVPLRGGQQPNTAVSGPGGRQRLQLAPVLAELLAREARVHARAGPPLRRVRLYFIQGHNHRDISGISIDRGRRECGMAARALAPPRPTPRPSAARGCCSAASPSRPTTRRRCTALRSAAGGRRRSGRPRGIVALRCRPPASHQICERMRRLSF
jgi:hypothetical protein